MTGMYDFFSQFVHLDRHHNPIGITEDLIIIARNINHVNISAIKKY